MVLNASVARIRDAILRAGLVDAMQMQSALGHIEKWGGRLPRVLVELGLADDVTVIKTLGSAFHLPTASLANRTRGGPLERLLDSEYCRTHAVLPIALNGQHLSLAVADPTDTRVLEDVAARTKCTVRSYLVSELEIFAALNPSAVVPASPQSAARLAGVDDLSAPSFDLDSVMPEFPTKSRSANTLLDEMLLDTTAHFTAEQLERLKAIEAAQLKSTAIFRAVQGLLRKKGMAV